ncbi:MAG: PilZ domain-containing protein [Polyangiaceae bacterium]|nr:PilZ domain-containing protein [Polyangiaceae bacterium]
MDRTSQTQLAPGVEQTRRLLQSAISQLQALENGAGRTRHPQLDELRSRLAGVIPHLDAAEACKSGDNPSCDLGIAYDSLSATLGMMRGMEDAEQLQQLCAQALAILFASGASHRFSAPPRRPNSTTMHAVLLAGATTSKRRTISAPSIEVAEIDEAEPAALELYEDASNAPEHAPRAEHDATEEWPSVTHALERRSSPRIAFEVEVGFVSETNFCAGLSLDVSSGGLFIATYQLQPVDSSIVVTFVLPSGHAVTTEAIVRWVREACDEASPGLGVSLQLAGEDHRQVRLFCAQRRLMFVDTD